MEAKDSRSKIRPLPVDDLDTGAPQPQPPERRRRIAPLLVIALGAVAFGVIAAGLGQRAATEVGAVTTTSLAPHKQEAPSNTTTTPPQPPALVDAVPFADQGLTMVALTDGGARAGVWHPSLATPSFNARIVGALAAGVNSDGTRVSVASGTGTITDVALGGGPQYFLGTGIWHPTKPGLFAWAGSPPGSGETTVMTVDLSAEKTSQEIVPLVEFSVPSANAVLAAWGDWGFAVGFDETIHIFDPDGAPIRSAKGEVLDFADDGTLLVADENGVPFLLDADGSTTDLPSLDVGATDYRITPDAAWAIAVTPQEDGHTSILARALNSRSTRITSVDQAARVVGMSSSGRFLILQSAISNDLFFKNWNTGAEYQIPIEFQVAAIYVDDGTATSYR
jgi:hypothetical protein